MATKADIENAILEATGNPDTGVIRDNLASMVAAVLRVVNPSIKTNFTDDKETRVMTGNETR
jgi:hypothetical protein